MTEKPQSTLKLIEALTLGCFVSLLVYCNRLVWSDFPPFLFSTDIKQFHIMETVSLDLGLQSALMNDLVLPA